MSEIWPQSIEPVERVSPIEAAQMAIDELRAENVELLSAIGFGLLKLDTMTTAEFEDGADVAIRDLFAEILRRKA